MDERLRGPADLMLRGTNSTDADPAAEVEAGGGDPADVGLEKDTDHPNPRDTDPESDWLGKDELGDDDRPVIGPAPGSQG